MTTSKPVFQRGDRLLYLCPIAGKLSPCQIVGRDISGRRKGWSIKLLDTGLGTWAEADRLYTGWEDMPSEFWGNVSDWKYGLIEPEDIEDSAKLENLDPGIDYGEIDSYIGGEVYGYWTTQLDDLTERDYASLADSSPEG
jgi:hypothetical protein